MRKEGPHFWVARLSVEMAVALAWLESGNEALARAGLKECLEKFVESPDSPDELIGFLEDVKLEREEQHREAVQASFAAIADNYAS